MTKTNILTVLGYFVLLLWAIGACLFFMASTAPVTGPSNMGAQLLLGCFIVLVLILVGVSIGKRKYIRREIITGLMLLLPACYFAFILYFGLIGGL
jgi:hypothetical protein